METTINGLEDADLTASELALVTANEKAGLVSQLACHFCGLEFNVKKTRSFRSHVEEVHILGDAGYMCGICCEEFTSRKAVENHMSTFHRAPRPLGCGTCGETFRVRNLLLKHLDSHTKEDLKANKVGLCYCGECFEFFDSVTALQSHTMIHRERAVFVCGACGLQSSHRHTMVKHLETHVISSLLAAGEGQTEDMIERPADNHVIIEADRVQPAVKVEIEGSNKTGEDSIMADPETSYKCGVCHASFANLTEALGHAESHESGEATEGVEYGVLVEGGPETSESVVDTVHS